MNTKQMDYEFKDKVIDIMTKDVAEYVIKLFAKLDQLNSNLERIAKALESNNNQKIDVKKKRLFESTTTKKAPQKECTSGDYTYYDAASNYWLHNGLNTKLVSDNYRVEYYIDPSKFGYSTEIPILTYFTENLGYSGM